MKCVIPRKISLPESRCYRIYSSMQGSIYFCDQEYLCWGITILVKNRIAKKMKSVVVISMEASTKLIMWWVLSRGTSVLLLYSLILCFNSVVNIPPFSFKSFVDQNWKTFYDNRNGQKAAPPDPLTGGIENWWRCTQGSNWLPRFLGGLCGVGGIFL